MNDNFLRASFGNKSENEDKSKELEKRKKEQKIKDILYLLLLLLMIIAIILMLYFILRQKKHNNTEDQSELNQDSNTTPDPDPNPSPDIITDPFIPENFNIESITFYSTDINRDDGIADLPDFMNNWISSGRNATIYQQDSRFAQLGGYERVFFSANYLSQNGTNVGPNTTVDVFFDEQGNMVCEVWSIYGDNGFVSANEMHLFDANGNETQVVRFEQNNFQGASQWRDCIAVTDTNGNTYYAIEGQDNYETIINNINNSINNSQNRRLTNNLNNIANQQPNYDLESGKRDINNSQKL